jgi:hypothetical protein
VTPSGIQTAGAIGWATWLFLIMAGGLLLAINTYLIITARRMTRGGIVKAQEKVRHSYEWFVSWERTIMVLGRLLI